MEAANQCFKKVRVIVDATQEKVLQAICICRKRQGSNGVTGRHRYGSLATGGKYDESDDEDVRGMLYNNNLLLDDDDDEEEQIVIITKEKSKQSVEQRSNQPAPNVDHSVFQEGKGLLDMGSSEPAGTQQKPPAPSQFDRMMQRMEVEGRHESAVNEVMGEIEDQLDDSDDEDTAFMITQNSGTGGNEPLSGIQSADFDKQKADLAQYATTADASAAVNQGSAQSYDYNNYQSYAAGDGQQNQDDYWQQQQYAQHQDPQYNNYYDNSQQYYQQTTTADSATANEAQDLMAELDEAVGSDDDGLI